MIQGYRLIESGIQEVCVLQITTNAGFLGFSKMYLAGCFYLQDYHLI